MSNMILGFPFYSDVGVSYTPTLSGGAWSASLPLTNMQDRRLAKVARSSDALAASTQFDIDLGVARAVRVLALHGHNLSAAATVQWQGGTSAGASDVYDSTALAVSFSGVSAEDRAGINFPALHVPSANKTARYWRCKVVDTGNADGYAQIGRLVIAAGYQPTINLSYGAQLGLETSTVRKETDGGAAMFQAKPVRRNCTFALENIQESEAFANAWKTQRLAGVSSQLFFVFDPTDTTLLHERSFLCTMKELTALGFPYALYNAMPFALVEEL